MRATQLQFRSTKEKTPDFNYPTITHDGRRLNFMTPSFSTKTPQAVRPRSSFGKLEIWAKSTSETVGPGYYKFDENFKKLSAKPCAVSYKQNTKGPATGKNGYYMVGNIMVFDPKLMSNNDWKKYRDMQTVECSVDVASNFTNQETETVKKLLKTPSKFNSQKIGDLRTESSLVHPKPKEFYGCSSSMRNRQLESGFLTNSSIKTSHDFRSSKEAKTASVGRKRASQSSDDDLNTILVGINGAIIGRSASAKSKYSAPVKSFLMEQGWMSKNAKQYPAFAKPVRLLKLYSGIKKPRKYSISGKCKSRPRSKISASMSPKRVETPQQFTIDDDEKYEL